MNKWSLDEERHIINCLINDKNITCEELSNILDRSNSSINSKLFELANRILFTSDKNQFVFNLVKAIIILYTEYKRPYILEEIIIQS